MCRILSGGGNFRTGQNTGREKIAGSVAAGFLGKALGWYAPGEGAGWIASILGAAALLFVVQKVTGGSKE